MVISPFYRGSASTLTPQACRRVRSLVTAGFDTLSLPCASAQRGAARSGADVFWAGRRAFALRSGFERPKPFAQRFVGLAYDHKGGWVGLVDDALELVHFAAADRAE